ncbi:hypothetical protein MTO96_029565 [Rhipicephalus appendiculatus]
MTDQRIYDALKRIYSHHQRGGRRHKFEAPKRVVSARSCYCCRRGAQVGSHSVLACHSRSGHQCLLVTSAGPGPRDRCRLGPLDSLGPAASEATGPAARDLLNWDAWLSTETLGRRLGTPWSVQGNAAVTPCCPTTCGALPPRTLLRRHRLGVAGRRHLSQEHDVSTERRENVCATCDAPLPPRSSGHNCSDGSRSAPGPPAPRHVCPHCSREFVLQRYLRKHVRRHERPGGAVPVPVLERRPPATRDDPGTTPDAATANLPEPPGQPPPVATPSEASPAGSSPSTSPAPSTTSLDTLDANQDAADDVSLPASDDADEDSTPGSTPARLPPDHTRLLADVARYLRALIREQPTTESWTQCEEAWATAVSLATEAVRLPPTRPPLFDRPAAPEGVNTSDFTVDEVLLRLPKSENTAPGSDRLTYHQWKTVDPEGRFLAALFNACVHHRRTPDAWRPSRTVLIHKKGDIQVPSNWRPIALGSMASKCYAKCLADRLKDWILQHLVLSRCQKGFLPYDGVFKLKFVLQRRLDAARSGGPDLCAAMLDFTNAYGLVPNMALLDALRRAGAGDVFTALIQDLYSSNRTEIIGAHGSHPH